MQYGPCPCRLPNLHVRTAIALANLCCITRDAETGALAIKQFVTSVQPTELDIGFPIVPRLRRVVVHDVSEAPETNAYRHGKQKANEVFMLHGRPRCLPYRGLVQSCAVLSRVLLVALTEHGFALRALPLPYRALRALALLPFAGNLHVCIA